MLLSQHWPLILNQKNNFTYALLLCSKVFFAPLQFLQQEIRKIHFFKVPYSLHFMFLTRVKSYPKSRKLPIKSESFS
jgi:hypothetical protein